MVRKAKAAAAAKSTNASTTSTRARTTRAARRGKGKGKGKAAAPANRTVSYAEDSEGSDELSAMDINSINPVKRAIKEEAEEVLETPQAKKTLTRVLKAVEIPKRSVSETKEMKHDIQSNSSSSRSSAESSRREGSHDFDTPATSAVATPAEYATLPSSKRKVKFEIEEAPSIDSSIVSRNKGKRKRDLDDEQLDRDEALARALQEQEYQDEQPSKKRSLGSASKSRVVDSEDDSSELSDADYSSDGFAPTMEVDRKNVKKVKTGAKPSLPTRAARDKARKSIATKASLGIMDSEDEDDLSIYSSEFDSEALSDPESIDSLVDKADIEAAASITGAASTLPRTSSRDANLNSRNRAAAFRRRHGHWANRAARERLKLEDAHPEIKTIWDDLEAVPRIIPNKAEQPKDISCKLKSFQLEGLDWMLEQEQSQWKGGLLGDEMGMGKTIQAVSLIMSDYPAKNPTLVVVPPVALMQWQNEINEYTHGKLNVLVHHNSNPGVKKLTLKQLKSYDVIMISYSGLESVHRKESKGWKRDDGIVKENSKIHAIKFHRLILDEAHNIKTRTTSVAKACFALDADYKWCLSGTPVQNRIGEFFSLLRFLEVKPFACYFCKECSCAELHWSQDKAKRCTHCHHSGFSHVSIFNQELLTPITQGEDLALRKAGLAKLRLLTDRIMLRRMKRDHVSSMELPPKEVIIHNEFFGEVERDFSSSIMSNTARTFDTYVSRGVMLNNYANIFGLIMRMRQVANHPDLILKRHAEGGQNVLVCSICDETAEEPIRSRCHHEFCRKCAKDYVASFEGNLIGSDPDCPRCHIPLAIDFDQPDIEQDEDHVKKNSIINRIKMEDWTSSTKIEMLVYDLYKLRSKKQVHKSIVFSQFTSMLQLVEWRLRRAGFNTVMLDGSMSPAQRQKSIEYFMNNTDVEVFLVSLKAGGVALNLTEASRVFIIDPWWNPAAEWQSADRCHRIGQRRPCVITRLCIEDSVESRIVMLQEKKANMINGTINNDQVAMEKLTPEDMQFLFRGS